MIAWLVGKATTWLVAVVRRREQRAKEQHEAVGVVMFAERLADQLFRRAADLAHSALAAQPKSVAPDDFRYDAGGEPICVNFADYAIPTAREIPPIEVLISEDAPSPLNSLGVKGAGEGGANAAGAAIAAAIDDALSRPGAVTQLPVTPQRLREMLRAKTAR